MTRGDLGSGISQRGRDGFGVRGLPELSWNACFRCGGEGHWAQDCTGPARDHKNKTIDPRHVEVSEAEESTGADTRS